MKKLLLLPLFSLLSCALFSQSFEGIIEFKIQEGTTTENSVWYVKDNMVRIDEFEPGSRVLKGCYLINTKDSSWKYLNHKDKTVKSPSGWGGSSIPSGCTSEQTKQSKEILDYKTSETILKTPGDSVTFSYWLNTGKFGFFNPALTILGTKNTFLYYYWALSPKENTMPLLVVKKNAKGEETGRFEAIRIEKRTIDVNLFNVPADYKQL